MHIFRVNRMVGLGLAICPARCLSYSVMHAQIQYLFIVNMSSADKVDIILNVVSDGCKYFLFDLR